MLAFWLVFGGGAATAAPSVASSFAFSHSFASEGQLTSTGGTTSIAVEPGSGNVLVADGSVNVFAPDSAPSDAPLTSVPAGGAGFVAIDQASGAIYLLNQASSSVTES